MSAARLLDELLSGFAPPTGDVQPDATPAKAANPANHQLPRCFAADSAPCESARRLASLGPDEWPVAMGSQAFAADRNPDNARQSKQPGRLSQDSQDSQWLTASAQFGADLYSAAWTDVDISRFLDRHARLLRWGWPEPEAVKLADRLARRDRERDDRVTCSDCLHYRPGRCDNHRQAALTAASIGKDWATLLQRCDGFSERAP